MSERAEWLLKALYEAAEELLGQMLDSAEAGKQPMADEPSLTRLAAAIRNQDLVTAWHLEQLLGSDTAHLKLHDLEWLEPDAEAGAGLDWERLLAEFVGARRHVFRLLAELAPREWRRRAQHPFRGSVSVEQLVSALHEHDLEALARAQRLGKTVAARPSTRPSARPAARP